MNNFNFDEWADLYRSNPIEFERRRKQLIEEEIAKAPAEHRPMLRVLQFECDVLRESLEPLEATSAMTQMMVSKLGQMTEPLSKIKDILDGK
jgi:hypothetical protein